MISENEKYDYQIYSKLLVRSLANLISAFGYTEDRIGDLISRERQQTLLKYMFKKVGSYEIQLERKQSS